MAEAAKVGDVYFCNLCTELDDLSIRILNLLQDIISERQYLDITLKDGFINMAKSRYLMKGYGVSKHQINTLNLVASTTVFYDDYAIHEETYNSFHIIKNQFTSRSKDASSTSTSKDDSSKFHSSEGKNDSDKSSGSKMRRVYSAENPLNWFGVLVPDALKTCQSRFEQALETSVKIINLQSELQAVCEAYRTVRMKKNEILTR